MYARSVNILKTNSFFLFGARGTGKSTLLKNQTFKDQSVEFIDLLNPETADTFEKRPEVLLEIIEKVQKDKKEWICIDEVQKIPALLDVVHQAIEERNVLFALTGSSARKLRRGSANLLAGRAFIYNLYPLTCQEIGEDFDLGSALAWGTLPRILNLQSDRERQLFLSAYAQTYLKEEILAEQLIRKLPPFRRFLEVASQSHGQIVSYQNIARDIHSDHTSVRNYFQILEDTLVGFLLDPFDTSVRKRQLQSPKFYWFDTGIARALNFALETPVRSGTYEYGRLFESFVINEVRRCFEYNEKQVRFSYLRTKDDAEIDLIIERGGQKPLLIEIKSADVIHEDDLRIFKSLVKDIPHSRAVCLYNGSTSRIKDGIEILPWKKGIFDLI